MRPTTRHETRAHAIGDLLDELSDLLASCYAVPEAEQPMRWAADAEKITGCVALALATARAGLVTGAPSSTIADRFA
ncbi:hypothetical protein ACQP04_23420 [Pseudonocardia halophobica]|uniref:hypothetical protein n=1 Tax=Pseudonocardia halophobica TaxID=29401 RepID=UPI003D94BFAD